MRALCWEPDVATSPQFVSYVSTHDDRLRPRALQGLVRSWHLRWISVQTHGRELEILERILLAAPWDHPVLARWRAAPKGIVGRQTVQWAAGVMLDSENSPGEFARDWAIAESSEFLSESTATAVLSWVEANGSAGLPGSIFILGKLMARQAWPPESLGPFKTVMSNLVEAIDEREGDWRRQVTEFVIAHEWLGDPRPVANQIKWTGMTQAARQRLVRWLSEADIRVFFNHVLPPWRCTTATCQVLAPIRRLNGILSRVPERGGRSALVAESARRPGRCHAFLWADARPE